MRAEGDRKKALETCREVKQALREELAAAPAADVALRLASILQDEMTSDWLAWLIPDTTRIQGRTRFDPKEDLGDLESVIRAGFEQAPRNSLIWSVVGIGLARVRLLAGDLAGMNEVLVEMGAATAEFVDELAG